MTTEPEIIPYHTAPLIGEGTVDALGDKITFPDGRSITVSVPVDASIPGAWVDIRTPLDDGRESKLYFRITDESAEALAELLLTIPRMRRRLAAKKQNSTQIPPPGNKAHGAI
jgi:hypothetical protein